MNLLKIAFFGCLSLMIASSSKVFAQSSRIFRTEVIPYENRLDAQQKNIKNSGLNLLFQPQYDQTAVGIREVNHSMQVPNVWENGRIFLHLENVPQPYTLWLKGHQVASVEDIVTPAEFEVTNLVRAGENTIKIVFNKPSDESLSQTLPSGKPFEGSRLTLRERRSIEDFELRLIPDTLGRDFAIIEIKAAVNNTYNYDEQVKVCYDIYDPTGKLKDFNVVEKVIPGRTMDTVKFGAYVYGAYKHTWKPGLKNPTLYNVMLFLSRDGNYKEYIALKVGFKDMVFKDGQWFQFGKPFTMNKAVCNSSDKKSTKTALYNLKRKGINTITPSCPQPSWFYEECDRLGLYVIDCADISLPDQRANRKVGGTLSNAPEMEAEFIKRVKAMYYRSRNYTCVIAFSLGSPSGNGYNMYKAYQWLKSVEKERPILYSDANGEWNTDF